MKLATYRSNDGSPRVGIVDTTRDIVIDARSLHEDAVGRPAPFLASMLDLISAGEEGMAVLRRTAGGDASRHARPLATTQLLAPLPLPPQIRDCSEFEQHVRDAPVGMARLVAKLGNAPEPKVTPQVAPIYRSQPIWYFTNRYSVAGTGAEVRWPRYSKIMDYELELAAIIGRTARDVSPERAGEYVFGWTIFNDFSARDEQSREMQGWLGPAKGKSFDGGNVLGPWIVTRDEIANPYGLKVAVKVNGEVRMRNDTSGMMHDFEHIIAFLSRDETLQPGEVIGSGTVGGCCGLETGNFLRDGDVVELEVEGIGTLRNRVRLTV